MDSAINPKQKDARKKKIPFTQQSNGKGDERKEKKMDRKCYAREKFDPL